MKPAVLLLVAWTSLYRFFSTPEDVLPPIYGTIICEGRVIEKKDVDKGGRLILDNVYCVNNGKMSPVEGGLFLNYSFSQWYRKKYFDEGDVIRFKASVRKPRGFRNHNRDTFESFCLSRGISVVGRVNDDRWILKVGYVPTAGALMSKWRGLIDSLLKESVGKKDERALIRALVLGGKGGFDEETIEDFRLLGAVHLLVVSGLHVAVLAMISWWLIVCIGALLNPFLGQIDIRPFASIITLIMAWFFIALTGFGTPAVRAGVMITAYIAAFLIKRDFDRWDTLSLAAIVILVIDPSSIFNVSFQLTFAAVVGIFFGLRFLLVPDIDSSRQKRIFCRLMNVLLVSVFASAGIFPLLAYHFGRVPVMGPFASVVLAPLATFIIVPASLTAALIAPVSNSAAGMIFCTLEYAGRFFLAVVRFLANHLEWSGIEIHISGWQVLTLYALMIIIALWKELKRVRCAALGAVFCLTWGFLMPSPFSLSEGEFAITFLDVGQGASVVLRLPNGRVYLVDGGGIKGSDFDLGKRILAPFLKRAGIKSVDRIIITHPHPDHYKGLAFIAENFGPQSIAIPDFPDGGLDDEDAVEWKKFLSKMDAVGVSIEKLSVRQWMDGHVSFNVFSPPPDIPRGWSVNDASAVIKISFFSVSFLITGDIESQAEGYLTAGEADISSTILQVPHHGSRTSSSPQFIERVSPKYAVIQVGASNRYGFPVPDVVERYNGRGVKLFRTDIDGAVTFVTDGEKIRVYISLDRTF